MKRVKIKERFENAVEAFFDDEKLCENNALIIASHSATFDYDETESFARRHQTLIKLLRRTFLFLPGVFVLFFMTVALTGFVILRPSRPPGAEHHLYLAVFVTLVSALMTFLGLGDLRRPKHFFIPLSVVALSMILGVIGSFTHGVNSFPNFIDHYASYFLPLAFVLPFLVKGLADKTDGEKLSG